MHESQLQGAARPPTSILQLEMSVNTSDGQLIKNLEACKKLKLPTLSKQPVHEGTLYICGSGPSLARSYMDIPKDAEILALNGAYKWLGSKGIWPAYFAMLDARAENINFLEEDKLDGHTEFFLASQCHPKCFKALKEYTLSTFHLSTPTTQLVFPKEPLYVGGGGTVGLTALALAIALGYRHVVLLGYDSSFDGQARHVAHQPQNDKLNTLPIYIEDREYVTTHAMAAQAMDFFPFYNAIRAICPEFTIDLMGDGLFYDFVTTNNRAPTRERELSKYVTAYQLDDYGMTRERRDAIKREVSAIPEISHWLDVSCGRAETREIATELGIPWWGTETVPALVGGRVQLATLPHTGLQSKAYDLVSLIEVIEHLLPEDLEPALRELERLARKHILISAAIAECWIGGVNLHPSAMSEEKWGTLFRSIWGDRVQRVGDFGGSPGWRVDL
jgi:uncharacterized Rossmann fold enzyme